MPASSPILSRRNLLLGGGTVLIAAAGGLAWRAASRGAFAGPEGPAFSAWELWNDPAHAGTPIALVAAGIIASNPHNTQPWLFEVAETRITVYADTGRNLGSFDAYLREMFLGLGCALENMALAARSNGFSTSYETVPGSLKDIATRAEPVEAFTIRLATDRAAARSGNAGLYEAIPYRHTNRGPYVRPAGLPEGFADRLRQFATAPSVAVAPITDGPNRAAFDALLIEGTEKIIADPDMTPETHHWFRTTMAEVEEHRDGVSLHTSGVAPALIPIARMLPELSLEAANQGWLDGTKAGIESAPLAGLISVEDRFDRAQTIEAGRTWQRIHLHATARGVAMQPVNQPVEWVDREIQLSDDSSFRPRLAALSPDGPSDATFAFRAGIAEAPAPPSARRALGSVTIGSSAPKARG